mmetsp:Transcript_19027/g.38453  ORF Transcript_19027/g.38453 Transcript_19027/m.38453 type:complete len:257 (-) Transcript_19027:510-1280(-)
MSLNSSMNCLHADRSCSLTTPLPSSSECQIKSEGARSDRVTKQLCPPPSTSHQKKKDLNLLLSFLFFHKCILPLSDMKPPSCMTRTSSFSARLYPSCPPPLSETSRFRKREASLRSSFPLLPIMSSEQTITKAKPQRFLPSSQEPLRGAEGAEERKSHASTATPTATRSSRRSGSSTTVIVITRSSSRGDASRRGSAESRGRRRGGGLGKEIEGGRGLESALSVFLFLFPLLPLCSLADLGVHFLYGLKEFVLLGT